MKSISFCFIIISRFLDYICINVTNYGSYQCIQLYALGGAHWFICNYASNCIYQYENHELKRRHLDVKWTWSLPQKKTCKNPQNLQRCKMFITQSFYCFSCIKWCISMYQYIKSLDQIYVLLYKLCINVLSNMYCQYNLSIDKYWFNLFWIVQGTKFDEHTNVSTKKPKGMKHTPMVLTSSHIPREKLFKLSQHIHFLFLPQLHLLLHQLLPHLHLFLHLQLLFHFFFHL